MEHLLSLQVTVMSSERGGHGSCSPGAWNSLPVTPAEQSHTGVRNQLKIQVQLGPVLTENHLVSPLPRVLTRNSVQGL